MQTSKQWWAETKADPEKLKDWLIKQYRGEVTASERILNMPSSGNVANVILEEIADDEAAHARWVLKLLEARGITPGEIQEQTRYWTAFSDVPNLDELETQAAIAHHAETMRLERIRAICEDEEADVDIRNTFKRILIDEEWHARAFGMLATSETIEATRPFHALGRELLGLEP